MTADDFLEIQTGWLGQLQQRVAKRELSLDTNHIAARSFHFSINSDSSCVIGKTHHSKQENRKYSYIRLDYSDEIHWKNQRDFPSQVEIAQDVVDIFAVVIDNQSDGRYDPDQDDFLVLTEEILEEVPESGKKKFRITSDGYRDPFDRYLNSWERIFENLEE